MIPRTIHQIYFQGDPPADLQRNVDRLKALNPGWNHRLWDNLQAESHIRAFYGDEMLNTYRMIDPRYGAPRSDFVRHLLLHTLGGVYFDIKSGCETPLDELIRPDDSYLLAQWPEGHPCSYPHRALAHIPGGEFVTWFVAAEPAHPFSAAMISTMVKNVATYTSWSGFGRTGALQLAGPIAYTLAIHPILSEHPHRFVPFDGLYYSIEYDHQGAFPQHYSQQIAPIVQMGAIRAALHRLLVPLRTAHE